MANYYCIPYLWINLYFTVMMEGHADNFGHDLFKEAIKTGVKEIDTIIIKLKELRESLGKPKRDVEYKLAPPEEIFTTIER